MAEALPDSVQQIAEVIGADSALTLVRNWPRISVNASKRTRIAFYVPKKLLPNAPLIEVVGADAAAKLVERFGGSLMFLADCDKSLRAQSLSKAVIAAIAAGATTTNVGRVFNISQRHARRIVQADLNAKDARMKRGDDSSHTP